MVTTSFASKLYTSESFFFSQIRQSNRNSFSTKTHATFGSPRTESVFELFTCKEVLKIIQKNLHF